MAHGRATDARGLVVELQTLARPPDSHEAATLRWIARRLAALLGYDYAGAHAAGARYDVPPYFVPDATLTWTEAQRLGIFAERQLFGGVVPHAFVAAKTVGHRLLEDAEAVPPGWAPRAAAALAGATLTGYAAFSPADARRACARLAAAGHRVRFKPGGGLGGHGQRRIASADALDAALAELGPSLLQRYGVVLEQDLDEVLTYSVGRVAVGELRIAYCGTQRQAPGADGRTVYGGSTLLCVRGELHDLLDADLPLPDERRRAVELALRYDAALQRAYPAVFASRRNYDVAFGRTPDGAPRCGVLEQSWRVGGATPAELLALEALRDAPHRRWVRARCHEIPQLIEPPARAAVSFRGIDATAGPLTKYAIVDTDGDPTRDD
ncbi:DUF3182 family protein [Vulcaniibacterium tengchongense]|uniref:Uncharacterized protein DUF3182 n=1 Tax=Vulcaniibacterium tengchongense TaxID=1273429 RepID=A0A3N4VS18_9GAMM|nr:DUF3182 family protein [Vulcaniibacterium tengchongense]RPE79867.1 uncharacterized protein DUF3182 [Vulcaniibacterium tengchongense]